MTDSERTLVRSRLHAYTQLYIPVRSAPVRLWRWAGRHSALALILVVLVIAGGTGVSASWAHPGDALYDFRLNVNDRVETTLAFDDEAQIDVQMSHMERMIDAEDALRDEELSTVGYTTEDENLDSELSDLEQKIADEDRQRDDTLPDDESKNANVVESVQLDDGSFERELRGIELELQAEDRARTELE